MVQRQKAAAAGAKRRPAAALLLGPASSEDEADEAPEEVSFGAAREAAATERKLVGEAARRHRELLREKRRRRQQLFAEQKKRKLLPEAVLQELAAAPPARPAAAAAPGKGQGARAAKQRQAPRQVKKDKGKKHASTKSIGNYTAVCLKEQSVTGLHQQLARDFVKAQLYGPGTNRAQANDYFSLENKKNPVKKAAVQFVDKSWGQQQKLAATRLTHRWLSAQRKGRG